MMQGKMDESTTSSAAMSTLTKWMAVAVSGAAERQFLPFYAVTCGKPWQVAASFRIRSTKLLGVRS